MGVSDNDSQLRDDFMRYHRNRVTRALFTSSLSSPGLIPGTSTNLAHLRHWMSRTIYIDT
jgi:hypothetical protein